MEDVQELRIQWFPGHMVTALRMISEELKLCDVIIYMLDGRCPRSCFNPKFDDVIARKPTLFVLNKSDLAPWDTLKTFLASDAYKDIVRSKGPTVNTTTLDSTKSGSTKFALEATRKLLKTRIDAAREKGITKTIRAIVIGVTNCGKSTFINNLSSKAKALAGDKPGVTRTKQWVNAMDNFWILDTPGTLWPAFDNPQVAKNLAYVGSIKDDILDIVALSKSLLVDLDKLEPGCVMRRYGAVEFDAICRKRGYILRGGNLDYERAAKAILTEFRAGRIGRFNLDNLL
ncbi:MAG: ribosome biogenesis GTPase YlqF [Firmicutes bacterium]|nr:ribosome biogenesis GTPase YlqF [Bacillota bacterium]